MNNNSLNERVVLVTGGAGYIGAHTCKELYNNGYLPISYDNLVYGHESAVKWGPFVKGDINDRRKLENTIKEYKPGSVIHFAAYAYVGESVINPIKYYKNNVAGTLSLLDVMINHRINNIVFSSSCATYGIPEKLPITEENILNPINPYGITKKIIEEMLKDFAYAYDTNFLALRYFNAGGADPDSEIGENHQPETHLIPNIISAALGKKEHIEVYGNDYETDDGTAIRDYINVTDLAKAHVIALKKLEEKKMNMSLNLGTGIGTSVLEVISTVEEIKIKYCPRREGDPPILIASPEKVKKELNWKAECSSIKEIVETAWVWHQK